MILSEGVQYVVQVEDQPVRQVSSAIDHETLLSGPGAARLRRRCGRAASGVDSAYERGDRNFGHSGRQCRDDLRPDA